MLISFGEEGGSFHLSYLLVCLLDLSKKDGIGFW